MAVLYVSTYWVRQPAAAVAKVVPRRAELPYRHGTTPRTFRRNAIVVGKSDTENRTVPIQHEPSRVLFVPVLTMNYGIVPLKPFALIAAFPDTSLGVATWLGGRLLRLFVPFAFKKVTPN